VRTALAVVECGVWNMNKNTKKIALSAILSAVGVILLLIGSFLQVLDLSAAALAGFAVVVAVIEIRGKYPVLVYLAISLISILILPYKMPAVFFIAFGGIYPIFKAQFERFHPAVAWVLKFSIFNTFLWLLIFFVRLLLSRELIDLREDIEFLKNFEIIVFLVANFMFLLYDIVMTKIINIYIIKFRKLLKLENYF
jgi:hypothetical protein